MMLHHFLLLELAVIICFLHSLQASSIDEIIAASYESVDEFDQLADLEGKTVRRELDMLLTREQAEALDVLQNTQDTPQNSRKRRKAIKHLNYRWTNKVIPYTIATESFSESDVSIIKSAIAEWERYTCVTFREATREDTNKVYFDNGNGCSSWVGMMRTGSQKISLAKGCRHKGVVVHEIGHSVGFHHEQNRPDRDDYVRIIKENIRENVFHNFKKYPTSAVDTMNVPYDYTSVMHYGGTAFTNNGQLTIRTIDPKDQNKIGSRKGLSYYDIMLANKMYKCSENCARIQCPKGSFLGKDCQCWCPGYPIQKCQATGTLPPTTTVKTEKTTVKRCVNQNKRCDEWAKIGHCSRSGYVKTYCRESCGFCTDAVATTPKNECKDTRTSCEHWGKKGYCRGMFEVFMSEKCPKTCNQCGSGGMGNELKGKDNGSLITVSCSVSTLLLSSIIAAVARQQLW